MRSHFKILATIFCYTTATISYPHIRFNNNWINNDFIHQLPKLASGIEANSIFHPALSGNSILYQSSVFILIKITGVSLVDTILFLIPFTIGAFIFVVLTAFAKQYLINWKWVAGLAIIGTSSLIGQLRLSGKHSAFTYSLFFLALILLVNQQSMRKRALLMIIIFSVTLYHLYFSATLITIFMIFLFLSWVSNQYYGGDTKFTNLIIPTVVGSVVGWFSYLFHSPLLTDRVLIKILPPYQTTISTTAKRRGATKAATGIEQYFDVLTQRWEPWWIWFILTIPMFVLLIVGGLVWLRESTHILRHHDQPYNSYLLATTGGVIGILVMGASLAGFSATNLIFRYLTYFIPIATVFIIGSRFVNNWSMNDTFCVLFIILIVTSAVLAPIKMSREPNFQETELGIYSESDAATVRWTSQYNCTIAVQNVKNALAIYYIELRDYREPAKLPVQPLHSADSGCLERSPLESSKEIKIYNNGRGGVLTIDLR